jgi:predicted dehydrogenase
MVALRRHWQEHCAHPKHQPWRYVETERDLFPEEAQTQFLTRVQDESYSYKLVHLDPLRGGGLILGESVHWLDLACWFFSPQAPTEIRTWGSTRFSHGIHLTFSAGDTATILFHCGGTFDYPKELIEVASHGALFRNRFFVENAYYGIPGLERERFPLQRDSFRHVGREGGFDGYMKKYAARVKACRRSSKATINELVVDKGHENMLNVFVDAVLHDRPSPCGEMDGYLATYLARMACRSIELRQALPIPIDKLTPCLV